MLAYPVATRPVNEGLKLRPACPNCGRSMHLTCTPAKGGPSLEAFRCGECGVWLAESAGDQSRQAH